MEYNSKTFFNIYFIVLRGIYLTQVHKDDWPIFSSRSFIDLDFTFKIKIDS